ncbi:ubiquinol-cytochrome c reductase cytochrome b subunit [Saccharomonospora amisosensis]|uniref:Cytochrome bc1 complex cytochrome b subunit n=1 Tax=Saccharomonospora amisosensis TaxID=1128677 RepID=A0A7X5UPJ3_9PSEU|nr:cytochrome bc complex cytochrome b subunit [Saccharomonospora amisosensis]NIJ11854.1 ubiquinol-cytochrome c reductase cytochrome b subunit [Saccharomonospora amisosensis]
MRTAERAGRGTRAMAAMDTRFHLAKALRPRLNKVFPEHFTFLFGELALYSFVVLVVSGTYLALFFDPSMTETTYRGSYTFLQGLEFSRAYATSLDISFEVRGGLLVRQVHHWTALIFVAAIVTHMGRIFFTGAYRRPRELNWLIGVFLLALAILEGFLGYSMPDDLLSGQGVRIASGIVLSIPLVGTWLHWMVFGGEFPGDIFVPRFFTLHVFLVPGLILALVAVHLASVWYQEHTQFPGRRKRESNAVGTRTVPAFAMKSTGLATGVTAIMVLLGGFFQINPIFNYGPYLASHSSLNAQPDWYLIFVEGALRLFPSWRITVGGHSIAAAFWPAVVLPATLFLLLAAYPFIERKLTRDYREHHLLQRPRDAPVRTATGAMALTFFMVLMIAGSDDVIAFLFKIPIEGFVWALRMALFALPPLAFLIAYRSCLRLQRFDTDVLERGVHAGVVERRADGYYVEVRQPLAADPDGGAPRRPRYQGSRLPTLPGDLNTRPEEDNSEGGDQPRQAQRRNTAVPPER